MVEVQQWRVPLLVTYERNDYTFFDDKISFVTITNCSYTVGEVRDLSSGNRFKRNKCSIKFKVGVVILLIFVPLEILQVKRFYDRVSKEGLVHHFYECFSV